MSPGRKLLLNYFAYGSNMLRQRLVARVGDVNEDGAARLEGYRLDFDKAGMDGSGKCNISPSTNPDDHVWGVVFGMTWEQKLLLDAFEGPGYGLHDIALSRGEDVVTAFAYRAHADQIDNRRRPFHWYRNLVLAGAVQYELPQAYIAGIRAVTTVIDPDTDRHTDNTVLIEQAGLSAILEQA